MNVRLASWMAKLLREDYCDGPGDCLPAFVSPNVLNFLVEKFNITPIITPEEDLKAILG